MALSQADLDNLDAAIASGTLIARINDKEIRYQTSGDMLAARQMIVATLAAAATPDRVIPRHQLADFSDSDTP